MPSGVLSHELTRACCVMVGMDVVTKIEAVGSQSGQTSKKARANCFACNKHERFFANLRAVQVKIVDSGELPMERADTDAL